MGDAAVDDLVTDADDQATEHVGVDGDRAQLAGAIGVLRRLEERGVAVPATVSVTGFDDVFGADFCHPPLTTVTVPTEAAGRALVDVLLDDRAVEPRRSVLPVQLRVRASTGPASDRR